MTNRHRLPAGVSVQIPAPAKMVQVLGALASSEAESAASGLPFGAGMWCTGGDEDSEGSEFEEGLEHAESAAVLKAAG